jgi:hypothetical protein
MARQADDFLVKRRDDDAKKHPDGEAEFTYFGPVGDPNRFRFLVLREDGDLISILPGEGRFKKGLHAWRWEEDEGGEPTDYLVLKTRSNRIDLKRAE